MLYRCHSSIVTDCYIHFITCHAPAAVQHVTLLQVAGYGQHNTYLRENGQTVRVTRDQIVESVDKSLARLQTDYIDLLQIHW
jgi:predicted oxidoreductase